MSGGENGPPILNGGSDSYDRSLAFDAPVAFDTGLFTPPDVKTLADLRRDLMIRLGYAAMVGNPPPGMTDLLNSFLYDAQQQLYVEYDGMRTERWWAWQTSPGNRIYDVPIDGTDYLNFRRISWAGISDNGGRALTAFAPGVALALGAYVMATSAQPFDFIVSVAGITDASEPVWPTALDATVVSGTVTFKAVAKAAQTWYPLRQGIDPQNFTLSTNGMPTNFSVGRYLELWPAPNSIYVVRLFGHMGLLRFSQDTDIATIDTHPLFLFALALAKDHYLNAGDKYAQMARRMIAHLVAQSHGVKRYIPRASTAGMKHGGMGEDCLPYPMPRATFR